jgi:hypothetical protein
LKAEIVTLHANLSTAHDDLRAIQVLPTVQAKSGWSWWRRLTVAATACFIVVAPAAADDIKAISTNGKGELTKCSYAGCLLYHHVAVPLQIAVGDKVGLWYGSNPKHYIFPIVKIVRNGDSCAVFSQLETKENVDKIEFDTCKIALGTYQ